jgi:alpha-galactosidase
MRRTWTWIVASLAVIAATPLHGQTLPPQMRPVMGWNSWDAFRCDVNEQVVRETANAIVSSGMAAAGYQYVNVDDCWMAPTRDASGRLQADPVRFPSGIKALADYVHARGFKFGLYSSAGTHTCMGRPASVGREVLDAQTFAGWGVDFLKYDNCHHSGIAAQVRYRAMGDALAATGRDIVYAICDWGENAPWTGWADDAGGHMWRTTGDIVDRWHWMIYHLESQVPFIFSSRPGGWNDPDMLMIGNGGMTAAEYRVQVSLWAMLNAPLIVSADVRTLGAENRDTLINPHLIAVNQDWSGGQGRRVINYSGVRQVWTKRMSDGSVVAAFINLEDRSAVISATVTDLGLGGSSGHTAVDLWTHATISGGPTIAATVPPHDVVVQRVSRTDGDNPAALLNPISGRCLDVRGGVAGPGAPVILWDCHGRENQRWTMEPDGTVRGIAGMCLDAYGGASANGTEVGIFACHGRENQLWTLRSDGYLRGIGGKCVTAEGPAVENLTRLVLWDCTGKANQHWQIGYAR